MSSIPVSIQYFSGIDVSEIVRNRRQRIWSHFKDEKSNYDHLFLAEEALYIVEWRMDVMESEFQWIHWMFIRVAVCSLVITV